MTPEQRDKHLKTIEKIENLPRPAKWRESRKLLFALHPELKKPHDEHMQACKEWRQANQSSTASSKAGDIRNTMKIPNYVYDVIKKLDPEIMIEMSGRNHGEQRKIGEQLYKAFPEYRIARSF